MAFATPAPQPGRPRDLESSGRQGTSGYHSDKPPGQPFTVHHLQFLNIPDESVKMEPFHLFAIHSSSFTILFADGFGGQFKCGSATH